MNCVIVYNGVSGSGKSCVIDCIKLFYRHLSSLGEHAEYMGINNISITNRGELNKYHAIRIGTIEDISTITEYSRLLVKLINGPEEWIDDADYNHLSKYLRGENYRKLLVKLKTDVEASQCGLTNQYILKYIEKKVNNDRASSADPSVMNLFFVSMREPGQIKDFVENCPYPVRTLIISRPSANINVEDGYTEDIVTDFKYDYSIINPDSKDKILDEVKPVMHNILKDFAENTALNEDDIQKLDILSQSGKVIATKNGITFNYPICQNEDILGKEERDSFFKPVTLSGTPV